VIPDILARIVARKHEELSHYKDRPENLPEKLMESASLHERRDFAAALRTGPPAIIAEIKKASPSKGVLIEDFDPVALASEYQRGGAAAISVLTDRDFFKGALTDLEAARAATTLPVLRKDFTIHEYNVLEAASAGADAILLIAAILGEAELRGFREFAADFGIAALVEVHDAAELEKALRSGAEIVGVNNRDLRTFQVSLDISLNLASQIPDGVIKVSESGIFHPADVHRLMEQGFQAFLVGEHLLKSGDPAHALRELTT
jgi:indole-3-glycerol phosphate synthase